MGAGPASAAASVKVGHWSREFRALTMKTPEFPITQRQSSGVLTDAQKAAAAQTKKGKANEAGIWTGSAFGHRPCRLCR